MAEQLKLSISVIGKVDPRLGQSIKKAKNSIVGLNKAAEKSVISLAKSIKRRDKLLANRSVLKGQAVGMFALGVSMAAPIAAAVKFESVMADVKKVLGETTPEQFKTLKKDILELAAGSAISAAGVGDIIASAAEAGIATGELKQFAKDAIAMGVAFGLSAEEAGDTMKIWRAGLGLTRTESMALGDAMNVLGNNTAANSKDIVNIFNRVQGVGQAAGLANKDIAALGAAFKATGVETEIAATGMQNMLLALTAGEAATKKQDAAFKRLGFDTIQLSKAMQKDAQGAILSVFTAITKVDKADLPAVLTEIFGKESIKPISKLIGNMSVLEKTFGLVGDETKNSGSLLKEYAIRAATTENAISQFGNQINVLGITLGSVLLPPLNQALTIFGRVLNVVTKLADEFPVITKTVIGLTAALITGRIAMFAYKFVANEARIVLAGLSIMMKTQAVSTAIATGGFRAFSAAIMANPIGLIITGLAIAAGLVIANWEPIKKFFTGFWDGFISFANTAINKLREALGLQGAVDTGAGQTLGTRRSRRGRRGAGTGGARAGFNVAVGGAAAAIEAGQSLDTAIVGGVKDAFASKGRGGSRRSRRNQVGVDALPAAGGGGNVTTDNSKVENTFNITQQTGESGEALATRVAAKVSSSGGRNRRRTLHDGNDKAD